MKRTTKLSMALSQLEIFAFNLDRELDSVINDLAYACSALEDKLEAAEERIRELESKEI